MVTSGFKWNLYRAILACLLLLTSAKPQFLEYSSNYLLAGNLVNIDMISDK